MSTVDRRLLGNMKTSIPSMFGKYVVNVMNVMIYFYRPVMELKECHAYGQVSASKYTTQGIPPATIESEEVYDNIKACTYDNID